jgi:hypothetical protein
MRSPNQMLNQIAETINFLHWTSMAGLTSEETMLLAFELSYIESSYVSFDYYCQNVAEIQITGIEFYRSKYNNVLYICKGDKFVPLLMFVDRKTVIENSVEVCHMSMQIGSMETLVKL